MSDDAVKDEIFITQDGSHSITASRFGVSYHSKYGAITESRHVFIQAGLIPLLLNAPGELKILEMGLGTGLNVLLSYQELYNRPVRVYYEAVEQYPISLEDANSLNYPDLIEPGQSALKSVFHTIHHSDWDVETPLSVDFVFRKRLGALEEMTFSSLFDLIYFDAFAPSAQPELWSEEVLEKMFRALQPEGVLVTYCAKGAFKRTLKQLGFRVESLPGPPGKREMTKAVKQH